MLLLGSTPMRYAAGGVLAVAVLAACVQTLRLDSAQIALRSEREARAADKIYAQLAARMQAEHYRLAELAWTNAQQENDRVAQKARQAAEQHAAAAVVAADSLRGRVAALAATCRRAAEDPAPVGAGAAASAPADLFTDVFARLDAAAGELAQYADAARIAGEQCAADYHALTAPP